MWFVLKGKEEIRDGLDCTKTLLGQSQKASQRERDAKRRRDFDGMGKDEGREEFAIRRDGEQRKPNNGRAALGQGTKIGLVKREMQQSA